MMLLTYFPLVAGYRSLFLNIIQDEILLSNDIFWFGLYFTSPPNFSFGPILLWPSKKEQESYSHRMACNSYDTSVPPSDG